MSYLSRSPPEWPNGNRKGWSTSFCLRNVLLRRRTAPDQMQKNKQQNKQITIPKSKQKLKFNWKFYTLNRRHSLVCHHGQLPKITRFNQFKQSKKLWEKKHRSFNGIRSKSFKWIIMQWRMFFRWPDRHTYRQDRALKRLKKQKILRQL